MDQKLKIGIIGTGNISESHISAYQKNPDVELYAFCDIREDRLQEMGGKLPDYGCDYVAYGHYYYLYC